MKKVFSVRRDSYTRWEGKQSHSFPSAGDRLLHRSRGLLATAVDAVRGGQYSQRDEQVVAGISPEARAQQPDGSDQNGLGGGDRPRLAQTVTDRREFQQYPAGNGRRGQGACCREQ